MAGELYFNFGVPGILFGCILAGFVTGWLRSAAQDSPLKLASSALFFGMMVIYVRNPLGVPLKNMTWSVAAFLIIRGVLSLLTKRSSGARVSRPAPL
jgi:biotin transporter BioY